MDFQSEKLMRSCVRAPYGIRATVMPLELRLGPGAALLGCQLVDMGTSYGGFWWAGRGQVGEMLSSLPGFLLNAIEQVSFFPRLFAAALTGMSGLCRLFEGPCLVTFSTSHLLKSQSQRSASILFLDLVIPPSEILA